MIRQISTAALFIFSALLLASCSGVPGGGGGCTVNCGTGNATVSLVLTATPPAPGSQLSIQAFTATITGITLTPSTGAAVAVPLNATTYIAEFNRVTSDSTLLAAAVSVPSGTYAQMTVTFSAPRVTFCTQANAGTPGCIAGSLTSISGSAGSATITTNLSFAANQQTGLALNANLGAALTATGQTITAVNLGAASTFTVNTLPPASTLTDLAAGQLSHVDDVLGVVTSVAGSTLTVQTTTRGSITAAANSSTQFSSDCSVQTFSGCVQLNTVAIIDTILKSDGTFALTFYQPLAATTFDIIEGVVTDVPNSVTQQFTVAVTDRVFATTGSLLNGQISLGDQIRVTLGLSPAPFVIIAKGLTITAGNSFAGATSVSSVHPGQTVAFPVTAFTAQSGATLGTASTSTLALRFTRVTATIGSSTSPVFSATALPNFFGLATVQQFQTTTGRLSLDGVANLNSVSAGNTFSSTALYLGPSVAPEFSAQTVRAH